METGKVEALEARRLLSGVPFDSNFAGGVASLTPDTRRAANTAIEQADGKIVVAGQTTTDSENSAVSLSRYDANGSLDSTFGGGKPVLVDPTSLNDIPQAIAAQSDGRILLLLRSSGQFGEETDPFILVRLNANGSVDNSFGVNGFAASPAFLTYTSPTMLLRSDGKIQLLSDDDKGNIKAVQFTANGKLDASFGNNGVSLINDGETDSLFDAAIVGGATVLFGESFHVTSSNETNQQLILTELTSTGQIDPAFGLIHAPIPNISIDGRPTVFDGSRFLLPFFSPFDGVIAIKLNGKVDTNFGSNGRVAISSQFIAVPGKRIIEASDAATEPVDDGDVVQTPGTISVFSVKGKVDTSFAGDGSVDYTLPNTSFTPIAGIIAQADGKIVIVGTSDNPGNFALLRYTADGKPDSTFGSAGVVRSVPAGADGTNNVIAVQPDGKILVGADVFKPGAATDTGLLERYNADGTLDASFSLDPTLGSVRVDQIVVLKDGSIQIEGLLAQNKQFVQFVARLTSSGKLDKRFASNGIFKPASGGPLVIANDGSFTLISGSVAREYLANGSLNKKFGNNGIASISLSAPGETEVSFFDVDYQPDGGLILTGSGQSVAPNSSEPDNDTIIERLSSSGEFDSSFGQNGYITFTPGTTDGSGPGPSVTGPDGEIRNISRTDDGFPVLYSFDAHGHTDPSLDGQLFFNQYVTFEQTDDWFISDFFVQPDGKLVYVGEQDNEDFETESLAIGRLNRDGSRDTTFNFDGARVIDTGDNSSANAVALAPNGDLIVGGYANTGTEDFPAVTRPRRLLLRVRGTSVGGTVGFGNDGLLHIVGTDSADKLTASISGSKLDIILNGVTHSFTLADVPSIVAYMGDGNDSVNLGGIKVPAELHGEAGNDTLIGGAGDDTLDGGLGADNFGGAGGDDTVTYAGRYDPLHLSLNDIADDGAPGEHDNIPSSIETVIGGNGSDLIIGSNHADYLDGGVENITDPPAHDTILGLGGNDRLLGWQLDGGLGNDTLSGPNFIFGGFDQLGVVDDSNRTESLVADLDKGTVKFPSGEIDTLLGSPITFISGSGNDTITFNSADGGQTIFGGAGNDVISGNPFSNQFMLTYIYGGDGNDRLTGTDILVGGAGADTLIAAKDEDSETSLTRISYEDRTTAVRIDLSTNTVTPSDGDVLIGTFGGAIGGSGNDTIVGGPADETLQGGGGNDSIHGGGGRDSLIGNTGNDSLYGDSGDDTLDGGLGADFLSGGGGTDLADYSNRTEYLSLTLDNIANDGAPGEKDNILADVENITGGSGSDRIVGNPFDNQLDGGDGNDTIYGGAGNDSLIAGGGANQLYGQDGNDFLQSINGVRDSLDGGANTDTAVADSIANGSNVVDLQSNIEINR